MQGAGRDIGLRGLSGRSFQLQMQQGSSSNGHMRGEKLRQTILPSVHRWPKCQRRQRVSLKELDRLWKSGCHQWMGASGTGGS